MEEHVQKLNERAKLGGIDLLFVGDSITEGWRGGGQGIWNERFAPLNAANFGIGGDKTENLLWRLQNGNLEGLKPKVTVLMVGTNNVGRIPTDHLIEGVTTVANEITTRLPDTKLILMGLLPRAATPDHPHRLQVIEVNAALAKLQDDKRIFFFDIGDKMVLPDGSISTEALPDLLHLSTVGYHIWADAIQEKVTELMK